MSQAVESQALASHAIDKAEAARTRTSSDDVAIGSGMQALMRRHAGGVAIITTYDPTDRLQPIGFTATSLVSVSLDPPTVSFNVSNTSRSGQAWLTAAHGLVHVLDENQEETAERFAAAGPDKFHHTDWCRAEHGLPELAGCLGWLLVRTAGRMAVADHLVVAATVLRSQMRPAGGRPLVRFDGAFHRLA
jgi:flavin reductase (DIM6/NTAB) family NADH-FMN oxidoreductase RutF